MIEGLSSGKLKDSYQKEIKEVRNTATNMATYEDVAVLEKEQLTTDKTKELLQNNKTVIVTLLSVILLLGGILIFWIYRRIR
jgi:hypothetical protein